jgi:hypothetical protein
MEAEVVFLDVSLRVSFDRIAHERALMTEVLEIFSVESPSGGGVRRLGGAAAGGAGGGGAAAARGAGGGAAGAGAGAAGAGAGGACSGEDSGEDGEGGWNFGGHKRTNRTFGPGLVGPAMTTCLATTVQHLFDAVYSPGGAYNQTFRQQIQSLRHTHAEQLLKGKKLYDVALLLNPTSFSHTSSFAAYMSASRGVFRRVGGYVSLDFNDPTRSEGDNTSLEADMHAANEDVWLQLLQPFLELALKQLKGVCELHFDDLSKWLAVAWDGDGASERVGSAQQNLTPNLTINDEGEVTFGGKVSALGEGPKNLWISDAIESTISLLKHVGRIDRDLAFLASMGEMCENTEIESNSARNALTEPKSEPPGRPAPPIPTPPAASSANEYWRLDSERQSKEIWNTYFSELGYPWFCRQFLTRVFSTITLVDNGESGLVLTPVGKFMGYQLPAGRQFDECPGIVFRRQHVAPKGPKWMLAGKPPTATSIQRVCYRFENTHATFCSNDGSLLADVLYCNPKHYFAARKAFDFPQMRRWVNHVHDVDETGLPRNMVSA